MGKGRWAFLLLLVLFKNVSAAPLHVRIVRYSDPRGRTTLDAQCFSLVDKNGSCLVVRERSQLPTQTTFVSRAGLQAAIQEFFAKLPTFPTLKVNAGHRLTPLRWEVSDRDHSFTADYPNSSVTPAELNAMINLEVNLLSLLAKAK
jgi:hypothetical protein